MKAGIGSEAGYEFCYGPGFSLTVVEVKEVAEGLAAEPCAADALAIDDEENMPGLLRFFARAVEEGKAVIGGVS